MGRLYENDKGNGTEFVLHGSNLSGIVTILRRGGEKAKQQIDKVIVMSVGYMMVINQIVYKIYVQIIEI